MTARARGPRRRNQDRGLSGRLMTQSGPRTTAPMWARPYFTPGEWAVYTALWSYPTDSVFPTHQALADRAWVQWGTAKDAIAKMDQLGLLERQPQVREDGSDSSNTYYLVEVPTEDHLKALELLKRQRAVEQEDARKKRKAGKRRYEKSQVAGAPALRDAQGCDVESTPVHPTRGAMQGAPRGCDAGSTPGGAPQGAPGCGVESTHESLGVTPGVSSTGRRSTSASGEPDAQLERLSTGQTHGEEQTVNPSDFGNQEGYARDGYPLALTEWEAQLVAELSAARLDWGPRAIRIAVGSPSVRARTAVNPGLVRRAFLLAAADRGRPKQGYKGTYSPNRLAVDSCPLWSRALTEMRAEEAAEVGEQGDLDLAKPAQEAAPPHPRRRPVDVQPATVRRPRPTAPPDDVAQILAARGLRSGRARETSEVSG